MTTVKELLKSKGEGVWSIEPDKSALDALEILAKRDVGALPVIKNGRLAGILSERDYVRKSLLLGRSPADTPVHALMTTKVFYVRPETSLEACMFQMTSKRIRHLPVLDKDDQVVGMISIGDVLQAVMAQQSAKLERIETQSTGALYDQ